MTFVSREIPAAVGGWLLDYLMAASCVGAVAAGLGSLVVLAALAVGNWH